MNLEREREAFEQKFPIPAHWIVFDGLMCKYVCPYNAIDDLALKYQARWEGWLASESRDGYKLVPVEPTERMLDSAYSSISDNLHYVDLENIYKAMLGACDD